MYNRILTNSDRKKFGWLIDDMHKVIPEMMSRKIPEANVQQAFMVDTILKRAKDYDRILCVGSYEDTAYEYLKARGVNIVAICPEHNYDLHTYTLSSPPSFDIIFSTSVLEHVKNDEEFIADICSLLNHNGMAILTVDFKEDYNPTDKRLNKRPSVDYRLYTSKDYVRLAKIMEKLGCFFVDEFRVDAAPDFEYEGVKYGFSTMVFKRIK